MSRQIERVEIVEDRTPTSRCDEGFLRMRRLVLQNVYDDPANAQLVAELKTELRRLRQYYGDDTGEEWD